MARRKKSRDVVAEHSFRFRHVSGFISVDAGDVLAPDHPAVAHRPGWFSPAPTGGTNNAPHGEE